MKIKRVLHIVSDISYSNGITNVILNYYRNIDKSKFQFDFMYFVEKENSSYAEINALGGRTFKIATPSPRNLILYSQYLESFYRENNLFYDILHIHELSLLNLFVRSYKKVWNHDTYVIAHAHSTIYSSNLFKSIRNRIFSLNMSRYVTHYAACSKSAAEFWFRNYAKNAFIIKNAIDLQRFTFDSRLRLLIRKQIGAEGKVVIGHVGRLSKEKNHSFLIEVFFKFKKHVPNSSLLLIGNGRERSRLLRQISLYNLSKDVIIVNETKRVEDYYQAMDIFIFPSFSEGFGTAILEAQISGIQCVVSSGVPKEVDIGKLSFLRLEDGSDTWVDKIKELDLQRSDNIKAAADSGYCIKKATQSLELYYKKVIKEGE